MTVKLKDWNELSYLGKHSRVREILPKPWRCQICGKKVKLQLSNKSHEYKDTLDDWRWLCFPCHRGYDEVYHPKIRDEKGRYLSKPSIGATI